MAARDYFSLKHPLAVWRSKMSLLARERMYRLFEELMLPDEHSRVLDLGATPDTHLPDSNYFEKLYPFTNRIVAASIEDIANLQNEFPGVETVQVTGGRLPFSDKHFDIVFCSAVLEHVGNYSAQREFLFEIARVSKKFFVTTPNRWYPVDFHTILPFIHWLPKKLHRRLLSLLGYTFLSREENLNLLGMRDVKGMMAEKNCKYRHITFLGIPSNIIVYRD